MLCPQGEGIWIQWQFGGWADGPICMKPTGEKEDLKSGFGVILGSFRSWVVHQKTICYLKIQIRRLVLTPKESCSFCFFLLKLLELPQEAENDGFQMTFPCPGLHVQVPHSAFGCSILSLHWTFFIRTRSKTILSPCFSRQMFAFWRCWNPCNPTGFFKKNSHGTWQASNVRSPLQPPLQSCNWKGVNVPNVNGCFFWRPMATTRKKQLWSWGARGIPQLNLPFYRMAVFFEEPGII